MYRWYIQNLSGGYYGVAPSFPLQDWGFLSSNSQITVQPPTEISLGQWKLLCPSLWFSLESNCFQWLVNVRFKKPGPFPLIWEIFKGSFQLQSSLWGTLRGCYCNIIVQFLPAVQSCYPLPLIGVVPERCPNKPPYIQVSNLKYVSQDPELWWLAQESYAYSIIRVFNSGNIQISLNFQVPLGYFGFLEQEIRDREKVFILTETTDPQIIKEDVSLFHIKRKRKNKFCALKWSTKTSLGNSDGQF